AHAELATDHRGLAARIDDDPAIDRLRCIAVSDRPAGEARAARRAEIAVADSDLLEHLDAVRAGVFEQDVVEPVALDVQRGSRVAEILERNAPRRAVPVDRAAGLAHETVAEDLVRDAGLVTVLPEVRDQALADLVARMALL